MNQETQILLIRDNAKAELLSLKTIEDGIDYLKKVNLYHTWVKAEKKDAELVAIVAEQKLRTQRILGELIKAGQEKGEIATSGNVATLKQFTDSDTGEESEVLTIPELGITHKQSSNFQKIAEIPEDQFEDFIAEKKEGVLKAAEELTTAGAVRFANSLDKKEVPPVVIDHEVRVPEIIEEINSMPVKFRLKIKQSIK